MAALRFTKMHGIGNDYVYVDCFDQTVSDPSELARRVSRRRTGVGSDGLILICPSRAADCRMEMYNADGSRGDMCGNGIRCVGKYVYDRGLARRQRLQIETDVGIKTVELRIAAGRAIGATVDMGEPILDGRQIPVDADGTVVDAPLVVDGRTYHVTCISMGNPHCVVFVPSVAEVALTELGPRFEGHAFFPKRVNTEFVEVIDRGTLRMRVWERGSGETAACGTGACAVLVAAVLTGRSDRSAVVQLAGGDLEVTWDSQTNRVFMTGPAQEVFSGELSA
jgi:diaminopimelate epimerase